MSKLRVEQIEQAEPTQALNVKLLDANGVELPNAPTLQDYLELNYDYKKLQAKIININTTISNVLIAINLFKPFVLERLQKISKVSLKEIAENLKTDSWAAASNFAMNLVNGKIKTREIKNTIQIIKDFAAFWKENRDVFTSQENMQQTLAKTGITEIDKYRFAQLIATAIYVEKSLENFPDEFAVLLQEINEILTTETNG